ncbi:MAG: hypothetical protein GY839_02740 [candidate division Zixibacteria bacterium]|nr:hypothetical protein [candidate division Zixibacteria bacterium]
MKSLFAWISKALDVDLNVKSRLVLIMAVLILLPTFIFPLWYMTFWSYQYPDGLRLDIYSYKLGGGDDGNDITEINILNHYIGMAALEEENFLELKWIPLALGIFLILTLRAIIFGKVGKILDVLMMFTYFGAFSLWSFWYKLNAYGHDLDPHASVEIDPFTPPVFGFEQVGQFKVWSYPHISSYMLGAFAILLVLAMYLSLRKRTNQLELK